MDTRYPTESEAVRLRQLHAAASRRRLYMIFFGLVTLLFTLYSLTVKETDVFIVGIYVIVLIVGIYVLLTQHILTKCPRCQSSMTVLEGSCTQCGVYLDPKK